MDQSSPESSRTNSFTSDTVYSKVDSIIPSSVNTKASTIFSSSVNSKADTMPTTSLNTKLSAIISSTNTKTESAMSSSGYTKTDSVMSSSVNTRSGSMISSPVNSRPGSNLITVYSKVDNVHGMIKHSRPGNIPSSPGHSRHSSPPSPVAGDNVSLSDYSLHETVFAGDDSKLRMLLKTKPGLVNSKDKHGNTPLHLAAMKGNKKCIELLLAHHAKVKTRNSGKWSPLHEAVSYGNREIIKMLMTELHTQSGKKENARREALVKGLKALGDFYVEIKWEFHTWVPFFSNLLPSDFCRIYKKGACVRMDTSLVDLGKDLKWERGDITTLYNGNKDPSEELTMLDNRLHVYQNISMDNELTDYDIEEIVDILMSNPTKVTVMPTRGITFSNIQTGWIHKENKVGQIGPYLCTFFSIQGLALETKTRSEHVTEEDMTRGKQLAEILQNMDRKDLEEKLLKLTEKRASLPPPPQSTVTWYEYLAAKDGEPPLIGRPHKAKEKVKNFKATLAMSEEVPVTVSAIIDALQTMGTFKRIQRLREYLQMKFPPGFPVKLELPIFPTVTARVTFSDFAWRRDLEESLFNIPPSYKEDEARFEGSRSSKGDALEETTL